jgi:hypothetical protein
MHIRWHTLPLVRRRRDKRAAILHAAAWCSCANLTVVLELVGICACRPEWSACCGSPRAEPPYPAHVSERGWCSCPVGSSEQ